MQLLFRTARWEMIVLIAAFGAVTLWKLIQTANLAGLIRAADGSVSPGRVQMLTLTILIAFQYLLMTIQDPTKLPEIPSGLVAALGGSHLVYLGAKAWTTFQWPRK